MYAGHGQVECLLRSWRMGDNVQFLQMELSIENFGESGVLQVSEVGERVV